MFDFLPAPGAADIRSPYDELVMRTREPVTHKVAFRAHLVATLATGNHSVLQPARLVRGRVLVRHYPFLGFDHFVTKAREGRRCPRRDESSAEHRQSLEGPGQRG